MPTVLSWLIRHFSGGAWPGQYFFLILLQLVALFAVLRVAYDRPKLRWALALAVVLLYFMVAYGNEWFPGWFLKLKSRPFFYHLPYVFVGIALARGVLPKIPAFLALTVLLIPLEFALLRHFEMEYDSYLTPIVLLASICVTTVFLQSRLSPPASHFLRKPIQFVGGNTLTIFVANPLFIGLFAASLGDFDMGQFPTYISFPVSFLWVAVVVALGGGLAVLIRKVHLSGILN